ncbi:hypothetical protein [Pseudomonas kilonensis]|uniref:hypothetical protein n=1 Tax=Pseudomonas kilonensis TaxID=132476 RepID=UPI00118468CA|nr:hypothetical protein [Pseudomonas kilonensis]
MNACASALRLGILRHRLHGCASGWGYLLPKATALEYAQTAIHRFIKWNGGSTRDGPNEGQVLTLAKFLVSSSKLAILFRHNHWIIPT